MSPMSPMSPVCLSPVCLSVCPRRPLSVPNVPLSVCPQRPLSVPCLSPVRLSVPDAPVRLSVPSVCLSPTPLSVPCLSPVRPSVCPRRPCPSVCPLSVRPSVPDAPVRLSVRLSVCPRRPCPSVCPLSVRLSPVRLSVPCLSVCLSRLSPVHPSVPDAPVRLSVPCPSVCPRRPCPSVCPRRPSVCPVCPLSVRLSPTPLSVRLSPVRPSVCPRRPCPSVCPLSVRPSVPDAPVRLSVPDARLSVPSVPCLSVRLSPTPLSVCLSPVRPSVPDAPVRLSVPCPSVCPRRPCPSVCPLSVRLSPTPLSVCLSPTPLSVCLSPVRPSVCPRRPCPSVCPRSDHDLTPWGLFGPLSQLLRRGLDTGEVPAQVMVPAISCLFFHLFWELSRVPDSGASPADLRALRSRAASLLSLCQSCLSEPEPQLRETALQALQELLLLLGPGLPHERLRLRPEPALEAQLGLALTDLVFQPHGRAEALPRRRSLLAGFCRLLLAGVLRLRAAADLFKHYGKFFGDFGDIIRETLRGARDLDRPEWARTVLLSLRQLFTELLLQEGPELRGLPEFQEIRDLGRRLSLFFGLGQARSRQPLLQLHSEGIQFSLQPPPEPQIPGIPEGLPLTCPSWRC
ncbi:proline-rich protein 36-like [Vidua chalybeata]|uniref:proline-rich protein 36-like n=1 Tax=Vidua chalybeata TaxID=81927 RepID=UPI0023A8A6C9|nr:proline-rich protein 36-like [Vidua chalybeata]